MDVLNMHESQHSKAFFPFLARWSFWRDSTSKHVPPRGGVMCKLDQRPLATIRRNLLWHYIMFQKIPTSKSCVSSLHTIFWCR